MKYVFIYSLHVCLDTGISKHRTLKKIVLGSAKCYKWVVSNINMFSFVAGNQGPTVYFFAEYSH